MEPASWADTFEKVGIAGVIVLGVGYFVIKYLWPFLTAQINRSQDRLDGQTDRFAETIRHLTTLMAEDQRQHLNAFQEITKELRSLHEVIKNGNSNKKS
jgi:hypothetical protein